MAIYADRQNIKKLNFRSIIANDMGRNATCRYFHRYYNGDHDILYRQLPVGTVSPNIKMVFNYSRSIVDRSHSYLVGKPVTYTNELSPDDLDYAQTQELLEKIKNVLRDNNDEYKTTELVRNGMITGEAFEYFYFKNEKFKGKDTLKIKFIEVPAFECIAIYDRIERDELIGVLRYFDIEEQELNGVVRKTKVELYTAEDTTYFVSSSNVGFMLDPDYEINPRPNLLGRVPFVHYINRKDTVNNVGISDIAEVTRINDELNRLLSDMSNTLANFGANGILITKGGKIKEEDLASIMHKRQLAAGNLDTEIEFLTFPVEIEATKWQVEMLIKELHERQDVPRLEPDKMPNATSGVAIKMLYSGADQKASTKEMLYGLGLRKRIELIAEMINVMENTQYDADGIYPVFVRSMPQNLPEIADVMQKLQGIVSQQTLLTLPDFVDDIEAEKAKLKEEKDDTTSTQEPIDNQVTNQTAIQNNLE